MQLLRKFLKIGIVDEGTTSENTLGIPQGRTISPLLFNIYMNQLDIYINHQIKYLINSINQKQKEKGTISNKYKSMYNNIRNMNRKIERRKNKNTLTKEENRKFKNQLFQTTYINAKSKNLKIVYVGFTDDWILLTNGS